jgi:hypothetical protein
MTWKEKPQVPSEKLPGPDRQIVDPAGRRDALKGQCLGEPDGAASGGLILKDQKWFQRTDGYPEI